MKTAERIISMLAWSTAAQRQKSCTAPRLLCSMTGAPWSWPWPCPSECPKEGPILSLHTPKTIAPVASAYLWLTSCARLLPDKLSCIRAPAPCVCPNRYVGEDQPLPLIEAFVNGYVKFGQLNDAEISIMPGQRSFITGSFQQQLPVPWVEGGCIMGATC